jgi:hypothetical protein
MEEKMPKSSSSDSGGEAKKVQRVPSEKGAKNKGATSIKIESTQIREHAADKLGERLREAFASELEEPIPSELLEELDRLMRSED